MFVTKINHGGIGAGVSLGGNPCDPATPQARVRQGGAAVIGVLPTRRAGVQQLG